MRSWSEVRSAGGFRGRPLYPAFRGLFLGLCVVIAAALPATAQVPDRPYLIVGPALLPGVGLNITSVDVGRFVTREVAFAAGYRSSRDGSVRTVATIGGAFRLIGARHTVLQTPRRSLDVDLGFRLGPAILFRFEETAIDKNKRFTLIGDPFLRVALQTSVLISAELGIHRPAIRLGVWIPI
ncbi:MAG: hypothetical protein HKN29_02075 [Rhodothermales bacterium]|nr:hypothetical protein [Rhodothermales bacterium]